MLGLTTVDCIVLFHRLSERHDDARFGKKTPSEIGPTKPRIISLVSIRLLLGLSTPSLADSQKHQRLMNHNARHFDNLPSAIAERQRHASTFDNTQYFEHNSNKIPFGTLEWWDQKAREDS